MNFLNKTYIIFLLSFCSCAWYQPQEPVQSLVPVSTLDPRITKQLAQGRSFALSTQGSASTEIGKKIHLAGGNIIDVAIATSFALAVERPQSTGISGGGFLLYREEKTGKIHAIDFRERAPKALHSTTYQEHPDWREDGPRSAGVPGLVRGLKRIHERFGSLPWKTLVQPAAILARDGFKIYPTLQKDLKDYSKISEKVPSIKSGIWKLPHLSETLLTIAAGGDSVFYTGKIYKQIEAAYAKAAPGWFTAEDFKNYEPRWVEPLHYQNHGLDFYTMPLPSAGGVAVGQGVLQLEQMKIQDYPFSSAQYLHRIAFALQAGFLDRERYLGDGVTQPGTLIKMLERNSIEAHLKTFRRYVKRPLSEAQTEKTETTHFSIIDQQGNMVVSTQTINGPFGANWGVWDAGIIINNEMNDFTGKPGPDLVGPHLRGQLNLPEPGKTPLSSMAPTLVLKGERPRLAIGAPGGKKIISAIFQVIAAHLFYELPLWESIAQGRVHHAFWPDILQLETGAQWTSDVVDRLKSFGYEINMSENRSRVMAVSVEAGVMTAVSDPRDAGTVFVE